MRWTLALSVIVTLLLLAADNGATQSFQNQNKPVGFFELTFEHLHPRVEGEALDFSTAAYIASGRLRVSRRAHVLLEVPSVAVTERSASSFDVASPGFGFLVELNDDPESALLVSSKLNFKRKPNANVQIVGYLADWHQQRRYYPEATSAHTNLGFRGLKETLSFGFDLGLGYVFIEGDDFDDEVIFSYDVNGGLQQEAIEFSAELAGIRTSFNADSVFDHSFTLGGALHGKAFSLGALLRFYLSDNLTGIVKDVFGLRVTLGGARVE